MTLREEIAELTHPETGLPGWCSTEKAQWLADRILDEKLLWIVEIGVFGGRSLIPMALAVREQGRGGYVLGIDSFEHQHQVEGFLEPTGHTEWSGQVDWNEVYTAALAAVQNRELSDWCGILRSPADTCFGLFGPIDQLHIDGCHSTLAACRDVETWVPKVRSGGLVVIDDTDWATVHPALALLPEWCEPQGHDGGTWGAWRRK